MRTLLLIAFLIVSSPVFGQTFSAQYSQDVYSVGVEMDYNDYFSTTTYLNQHQFDASSLSNRFSVEPIDVNFFGFELTPYLASDIGFLFDYERSENFFVGTASGLELSYGRIAVATEYRAIHSDIKAYSGSLLAFSLRFTY